MSAEHGDSHEECRVLLKKKTAEFSKTEALLTQKVELLQIRIEDHIKREEQLKQMHDTMMEALQCNIFSDDGTNSIDIINKLHEEEKQKIIYNFQLDIQFFEKENQELKNELEELKALNSKLMEKEECDCINIKETNTNLCQRIEILESQINCLKEEHEKALQDK